MIVEEKNKAHFSEELVERSVNYFFKGCEHENLLLSRKKWAQSKAQSGNYKGLGRGL